MEKIPIIAETDILLVGGSTGGVEAALSARQHGKRVFCVTPYTFLGEDVCATARYWLDPDQTPKTDLSRKLFSTVLGGGALPTPMDIKYGLEEALMQASVEFMYMTYPVCLLRDTDGVISGLVVVNRSGFQAIRARTVIDTTERALVGRMTRSAFRHFVPGRYAAHRVVIGGKANDIPGAETKCWPVKMLIGEQAHPCFEYVLNIDLPNASVQSFSRAEVRSRLLTWNPDQVYTSDRLFILPTDRLSTKATLETLEAENLSTWEAFRCGSDAVYVLGACADLSDTAAAELMKPCRLMEVGRTLGTATTAALSSDAAACDAALIPDYAAPQQRTGTVRRADSYFRLEGAETIDLDLSRVKTLGRYDVLVAGGGTGGAPATIAAARAGVTTLVLEYLPGLGGVGTEGRIARYYHGNRCGFTEEMDHGVHDLAPNCQFPLNDDNWNTEWKKQWLLQTATEAGAEVWFGAFSVAALMDGNRVQGAVIATPYGMGQVRAGALVDATGNVDLAAAAGANVVNISKAHVAIQGTGLPPITPGQNYTNSDHTFVDDSDVLDITRAFAFARKKFNSAFDLAQIVDSRQRRQVKGELSLDPLDFLAHRTFPDTVVTARSNFDSHGFTIHPLFMAKSPDQESLYAHVPFRCLLPQGLEGILVTGLGVSAHRDALPVIRMQPDVQNQGYAAGYAAAMASRAGGEFRDLDIHTLQAHLVEVGIITPDVIHHGDSFPLSDKQVLEAVQNGMDDYLGLAVIFGNADRSIPLLQASYADETEGTRKLRIAHLLGLLEDATGWQTLAAALDTTDWDQGWNYTGMGQYGFSLSHVDSLLVALGRTRETTALPAMLRKAATLAGDADFSHLRALTLAFETLPSPDAVPHFERLMDAIGTHSKPTMTDALRNIPEFINDTGQRNRELSELLLARGLYACGDPNGKATAVLKTYSRDLHGHYARHARAVLGTKG